MGLPFVWASPVCTEYSRALTTRPRRLLEAGGSFEPSKSSSPMWAIENPATGLLKTRPFMERLPWVDVTCCKYGTPDTAVDQHALEAEARPAQARQPLRRVAGRQAPPGRGGSTRGSASHASCSTAFLLRCARRLRAQPQRSLRSG